MVDIFTRQQFEKALPKGKWQSLGIILYEYCYSIPVKPGVRIFIRSSVREDGVSSDTGDNSIRTWLQDDEGNFVGSKLKRWITRQPGWQDRLLDNLRAMWRIGMKLGPCPHCDAPLKAFKSHKKNQHEGWIYRTCTVCGKVFDWLGNFGT